MKLLANTTILVAEDERPVRMLIRVVLEAAGARVLTAEDGARALRLLQLEPSIDLLCSDVNMPRVDGHDLVRATRRLRPGLPIVLCTAAVDPGASTNVDGIISKPFSPSELVRTIVAAIDLADATPVVTGVAV